LPKIEKEKSELEKNRVLYIQKQLKDLKSKMDLFLNNVLTTVNVFEEILNQISPNIDT